MLKLKSRVHLDDEDFAKRMYKANTGKDLNLDNPQTFDEKLWWLKFNYRNPLAVKCSDKYLVREYIRDCGLGNILNELYGVYDRAEDINFDELPSPCFIKLNTGSGTNIIYDKNKPFNRKHFISKFNAKMKEDYSIESREWNYHGIEPKIVAEKVLRDKTGKFPIDYKFFCFNGKPKLVFVNKGVACEDGSHADDDERVIYDVNGNPLELRITTSIGFTEELTLSKNWEEMLKIAEKLSKPFPFVRVDLYDMDDNVFFGELTFYHNGGCNIIDPEGWAFKMGSWIDIDEIKKDARTN